MFVCSRCHLHSNGSRFDTCIHFCRNRRAVRKQGNIRCSPYISVQLLKKLKTLKISGVAYFNSIHKMRHKTTIKLRKLRKTTKIVKIIRVTAEIRTRYLPNKNQTYYHLRQLTNKYVCLPFQRHDRTERGRSINGSFQSCYSLIYKKM